MNRPRCCLIAALVAVSAIGGTTTANAGPPALSKTESKRPDASPEHARLTSMCGTWDVEMTFWFQPGRPGLTTKGPRTTSARSLNESDNPGPPAA